MKKENVHDILVKRIVSLHLLLVLVYLTVPSSTVNPTTTTTTITITKTPQPSTNKPADKEATTQAIPQVEGGGKTDPHSTGGGSNAGLIGGVIVGVILLILAVAIITVFMIR